MECRCVILFLLAFFLAMLTANADGRTKKVVIHVPYKVKKIKHTHTIYKTVHHHHTHHEPFTDYSFSPSEDHEHFHHMHIHDDRPSGQHSQPVPEINIPEFLPEVAVNTLGLKLPDIPHEVSHLPKRHVVPLYRRNKVISKDLK